MKLPLPYHSLSLRHISDSQDFSADLAVNVRDRILPGRPGQLEFLPEMLNGSQKKTAYAIRLNAERMIREDGLHCCAFLTLTLGDTDDKGNFAGVFDAVEASRRFNNLNRRVLSTLFERAIIVTERHRSGAIHFHLLGTLRGRMDIRSNFDFKNFHRALEARKYHRVNHAAEIRYKLAAGDELRALWSFLRDTLPEYGFGRAQLTPIEKTGEAVACYISKYIEKNVCNRLPQDHRKKLVRYIGWERMQLKPNEFEWNGIRAQAWRGKAREIVGLLGAEMPDKDFGLPQHVTDACFLSGGKIRQKMMDGSQARKILGPRWAWRVHRIIQLVSDQHVNFMIWDWPMRNVVRRELYFYAAPHAVKLLNLPYKHDVFLGGTHWDKNEWADYCKFFEN